VRRAITERVSIPSNGSDLSGSGGSVPSVSAHGRFVTFMSDATDLAPGSRPVPEGVIPPMQIFVRDRNKDTTSLVRLDNGGRQHRSFYPLDYSTSTDGRYVAFVSEPEYLSRTFPDAVSGIYLRDRLLQRTIPLTTQAAPMCSRHTRF
jgi:Tol biopolymer transport system component